MIIELKDYFILVPEIVAFTTSYNANQEVLDQEPYKLEVHLRSGNKYKITYRTAPNRQIDIDKIISSIQKWRKNEQD